MSAPAGRPAHRGPPRFLICRCGEAFRREELHTCRPKALRDQHYPNLYSRWITDGPATERELNRLGQDPAFAPGAEQRDFMD